MATIDAALLKKLQIKPGMRLVVLNAPPDFQAQLGDMPDGIAWTTAVEGPVDLLLVFGIEKRTVLAEVARVAGALTPKGILWIAYPKAKQLQTDLNRDILRVALEELRLEAVANVAVDEVWSALRFKRIELT